MPRAVSARDHKKDEDGVRALVGCGRWPPPGAPIPAQELPLNNKGTRDRYARDYTSVAQLIADPPPGLLEGWSHFGDKPLSPAEALNGMTLVVEDASPDSVIGVVLLLARLANVDLAPEIAGWVDAVDDWERNGNADDPWTSWCVLASALAHSHFPIASEATDQTFTAAWTDVLRFAAESLLRGLSPRAMPPLPDLPEWRRANAALRQEQGVYLDWLSHATVVQLSLPMSGAEGRRVMVDGLLFVEDQATGGAKTFYRNDRQRSPLGQGFAFAAHYRPTYAGTGESMTISVDPRRGVDLRELWTELERRETAAWIKAGEGRPDRHPRALQGVVNRYDQPWFIAANGTLIGAPAKVRDGRLGSKLGWDEVRDAIWTVYNPLSKVRVCASPQAEPVALLTLPATIGAEHGKTLFIAHWPRRAGDVGEPIARALLPVPIVGRVLAALIGRGRAAGAPSLNELPVEGTWDRVELAGGFAVIGNDGLFILDDWGEAKLPVQAICAAFEETANLDKALRTIHADTVGPLVEGVRGLLDPKNGWKGADRLMRAAALASSRLTELHGSYALPPDDPNARLVWEALNRRWGIDRRLAALEAEVKAIETSLRSLNESRLARVGRFIALYGFPLVVTNVFGAPLSRTLVPLTPFAQPTGDPPSWFVLATMVVVWAMVAGSLSLWLNREGRLRR